MYGDELVHNITSYGDEYFETLSKKSTNLFWRDVFLEWGKAVKSSYHNAFSSESYIDTSIPIWHNSYLKVNHKSIYIKSWSEKGIKFVHDFLDENGHILQKFEFERKFGLDTICVMQFNSFYSAFSSFLRRFDYKTDNFVTMTSPYIPCHLKCLFNINEKCTRIIYKLLTNKYILPTGIIKWNQKLGHILDNDIDNSVFKACFKITNDSSTQWLQYRILHRILPTNSYLKKIKVKESDACSFCNAASEDLTHVFFECPKVLPLWNLLSEKIYNCTSKRIGFNLKNIIIYLDDEYR